MLKYHLVVALLFFVLLTSAQTAAISEKQMEPFNLGFERLDADSKPDGWFNIFLKEDYKYNLDSIVRRSGKFSIILSPSPGIRNPGFGGLTYRIPAKFEGNEITVKFYMKLQEVSKFAGFIVRIQDAANKVLQFENLLDKKIKGNKDWKEYTIKLPLPEDAQLIEIGPLLGGTGRLWVDDIQILIDGEELNKAKLKSNYNPNPPKMPSYGTNDEVGRRLNINNANYYFETYGQGEPLLLLHGNSQSIRAFSKQIPELAKYYPVIAVDTRAHGKSQDFNTGPLTYDLFADDMKQLLDTLGIKKAKILGWSDGGNTGLIMAIKYPHYVEKLAVMGAVLFPTEDVIEGKILKEIKRIISSLAKKDDLDSKAKLRLYTMLLKEPHIAVDSLKTIRCATLIMAGEHDMILDKHTRLIAKNIHRSELLIFKDATHYAPVENVLEFNAAVLDFFKKKE